MCLSRPKSDARLMKLGVSSRSQKKFIRKSSTSSSDIMIKALFVALMALMAGQVRNLSLGVKITIASTERVRD